MLPNLKKRKDLLNCLLLGLFLLIAYLPLSSLSFALKNDALTDNFPNKYFFSAALLSGHLPLWNPYINFGLPLYADPGFAFWNPLTWLFGWLGYNLYTLSVEILVYIWLGGIFMYQLGKYFRHPPVLCFSMAAMYMCCGFFIGNLEHTNFLTCAAFLPLVTRTFLQLHERFSFRSLLACTLSLYLLATGGHPAIPFATAYFLAILSLGLAFFRNEDGARTFPLRRLITTNSWLILGFAALAAPLLYSWLEIFPWFDRSTPLSQWKHLELGFTPSSYLSFLLPFGTTVKTSFFGNDVLMRNGYFSFAGFALLITALLQKKNNYQRLFLAAGAAMLLLSLGGPIKELLYSNLPLLKFIGTNGEFRIFALFSFIIIASFPFKTWIEQGSSPVFRRVLFAFSVICIAVILWTALHPAGSILLHAPNLAGAPRFADKIKWWLSHFSFYDRLLINATLLLFFLLAWFLLEKKISPARLLPGMILADLLLFCWLHLPITGVQERSPSEIERHYFSSVRPGIPIPSLRPIRDNDWQGDNIKPVLGCWSYYSKQPGTPGLCDYPTLFTSTGDYFRSPLPAWINQQPFVFLNGDPKRPISVQTFSPDKIILETAPGAKDTLILLQNFYPHWKASVNDKTVSIQNEYISFIGVPLEKGQARVELRFQPLVIWWPILLSLLALTAGIIFATRDSGNPPPRKHAPGT